MAVGLLTTLAAAAALLGAAPALSQSLVAIPADAVELTSPGGWTRFVVEFSEQGSAKFRKRDGSADTEGFFGRLAETSNNTAVVPGLNFTSDIFHGASFDLADHTPASLARIEALPEVLAVYPVAKVLAPAAPELVGQTAVDAKWDPHVLTRVNDAHALGFDGSDVVVAVVDSGIDYNHPALGGGFGPGFKVEAGWDFVGDAYDVNEPRVLYPDEDPMDCLGHGTHVAGIIASADPSLPGLAPNARLRSYKVFGCGDGTMEDTIAAAFVRAYEEGADVITASLGSNVGFPDSLTATVISRITARGTFVSAAAGNSGDMGAFFTSSLANAFGSVTVGSVNHDQLTAYSVVAQSSSGETREIIYVSDTGTAWALNGTKTGWVPPSARDLDVCINGNWEDYPDGGWSDDVVTVLPRGRFSVCDSQWQLMDSVLQGRTKNVFYYQHPEKAEYERPARTVYRDNQPTGFAMISYTDGIWLEDQQDGGNTLTFTFTHDPSNAIGLPDTDATRISSFSSWGPTLDGRMKPDISAPGGRILSTYLVEYGSWAVYSGTSMATPYIAGVAALYFQSVGGRLAAGPNPADLAYRRITSSGQAVKNYDGDVLASVCIQGAGLVDALKVTTSATTISPAVINLNDTVHFNGGAHTVTIENKGDEEVTYQIGHESGPAALVRPQLDAWIGHQPPMVADAGQAGAVLSTTNITVPAGGKATFEVVFTEPEDVDPLAMPIYGGYVHVVGSNGDAVKVTYMGTRGSVMASDGWETHRGIPAYFGQRGYGDTFEDGRVFNMSGIYNVPVLYFNLLFSTREFSFEIVSPDWQPTDWAYPVVPGQNKIHGTTRYHDGWTGTYHDFPIRNYPRTTNVFRLPIGDRFTHDNSTVIPDGEYRILARLLRTFGEHDNPDHWQFHLSNSFFVELPGGTGGDDGGEVVEPGTTTTAPATAVPSTLVTVTAPPAPTV